MSTQLSPQIAAQAADWFRRHRTGDVSGSECEEFLRWLQQSPQYVQAYLEVACMYPDIVPLIMCDRLIKRMDEPCSTARAQGSRDGSRRRSHKRR